MNPQQASQEIEKQKEFLAKITEELAQNYYKLIGLLGTINAHIDYIFFNQTQTSDPYLTLTTIRAVQDAKLLHRSEDEMAAATSADDEYMPSLSLVNTHRMLLKSISDHQATNLDFIEKFKERTEQLQAELIQHDPILALCDQMTESIYTIAQTLSKLTDSISVNKRWPISPSNQKILLTNLAKYAETLQNIAQTSTTTTGFYKDELPKLQSLLNELVADLTNYFDHKEPGQSITIGQSWIEQHIQEQRTIVERALGHTTTLNLSEEFQAFRTAAGRMNSPQALQPLCTELKFACTLHEALIKKYESGEHHITELQAIIQQAAEMEAQRRLAEESKHQAELAQHQAKQLQIIAAADKRCLREREKIRLTALRDGIVLLGERLATGEMKYVLTEGDQVAMQALRRRQPQSSFLAMQDSPDARRGRYTCQELTPPPQVAQPAIVAATQQQDEEATVIASRAARSIGLHQDVGPQIWQKKATDASLPGHAL